MSFKIRDLAIRPYVHRDTTFMTGSYYITVLGKDGTFLYIYYENALS